MINEITVIGTKETSFHNFSIVQENMDISISPGVYWRGGAELASSVDSATITIDSPTEDVQLEVWLCSSDGEAIIELLPSGENLAELSATPIDRIAWFTVPAGMTTLDGVEINVIRMVDTI